MMTVNTMKAIMRVLERLDDAAAENVIVPIEDCGLSWAQSSLWLMEDDSNGVRCKGLDGCRCGRGGIPDLDRDLG